MKNKRFCKKLLCMLLFFAVLLSAAEGAVASAAEESCELPVVRIDSAVGAEGSNSYEAVTVSIENAPAQFRLEPSEAVWKLHGRSSARSEKKSFNLKFPGRVDLFGMGAAKKWVLVANSYDRTMLRNKLMYDLSGEIGMRCPMESCFVELYINGEYRGVYQLCEAPEIDKERVAIHPAREEFLLEYLLAWREASDPVITTPVYQLQFMLNSLDYLPPDQRQWLASFFAAAENAVKSGDREAIAQYFDLDSMVDGYILYEFSKNADFAIGSTRFILEGGKLYAGPAWDFDLACGNDAYHCDPLHLVNGTRPALTDGWYAVQLWYRDLVQLDWFRQLFAARYLELQPILCNLYEDNELGQNRIDALTGAMPGAIAHNYSRWDIAENEYLLVRQPEESYEQNVEFLRSWLRERNEWILSELAAGEGPGLRG